MFNPVNNYNTMESYNNDLRSAFKAKTVQNSQNCATNGIVQQQPTKKELSTGAKIAIGVGIVTALVVGCDVLACKSKHIKQLLGKGKNKKGGSNKPSTMTNDTTIPSTTPKTSDTTTKPSNVTTTTSNTRKPKFGERRNPQNIHHYSLYNRTTEELTQECAKFYDSTKAILHVPDTMASDKFGLACQTLERVAKDGNFPKDIKHVLVGHGYGSSVRGDWSITGRGGNVFEYINNNPQIKPGEKVLVLCCEHGEKIAGRPGVGDSVTLSLTDSLHPVKIVIKGENKVAGDLYFPRLLDGCTVPSIRMYSDKPPFSIKPKATTNSKPATTINFDGQSPVNISDYTPVQQRAREFAIRESQIFRRGTPSDMYTHNVSPETIYKNAISTRYSNMRSANYKINERYNPNIDQITSASTPEIRVSNQSQWNYRIPKTTSASDKSIDRISLNVYPDEQLITELDKYMASGKIKGYYKTPDRMMDWGMRHDPITIYLQEPVNQDIINEVVRISKPHIRSTEDVLLGKQLALGVALDKSPSTQDLQNLIAEARQYDETLAHLLETSHKAGFARNPLANDYTLHASAGQVAAVRALLDDLAKVVS